MTVPERRHLASLVATLAQFGDQEAVVVRHGVRRVATTYAQLARNAGRFAALLEQREIRKGDRVLLWGDNSAQWLAAYFGCLLRGVIPVPIDFAGSPAFAHRVVNEVRPKLAIGDAALIHQLDLPKLTTEAFEQQLPATALNEPIEDLNESDTLQIIFTSGTTAEPKGVVHTHGNILASLRPIEREMAKYGKYERWFHPLGFLHTLPLSHVFGQFMGIWIPAILGPVVHFESRLVAADLADRIKHERINVAACVPRVIDMLANHLRQRLPNLDERIGKHRKLPIARRYLRFLDAHRLLGFSFWAFVSGGATLPPDLEQFWATLGFPIIQGYGMTETGALVSVNHPFRASRGSIGEILPGREVRITDEGEILVRGATVAAATWEKGELRKRDSEWLSTGDLAALDQTGHLRFKGRKKDVIVTAAGMNIYPEDLETALQHQPGLKAATIIEQQGEPHAVLILKPNADPAAIVNQANTELAEYQRIRRWSVWPDPDFPRTSSGKVIRRQVAANLSGTMLQRLHLPEGQLNLDSLARVELEAQIEQQYGISVALQDVQTAEQLQSLLQQQQPKPATEQRHIYPQWPWSPLMHAARVVFLEAIARPLVWLLANPSTRTTTIPPGPPVLIVANHVSAFDVPLILYALEPRIRRRTAVAMAGELLYEYRTSLGPRRLAYWLITGLFNVFPLPQKSNFRDSFAHAGKAMDNGFHVIVFPEGRRTLDASMHEFQRGTGILWQQLDCRAVPVFLAGAADIKANKTRWFRSGQMQIRVGEPLPPPPPNTDPAQAAETLEDAVRDLQ